jgi:hypothetical protein
MNETLMPIDHLNERTAESNMSLSELWIINTTSAVKPYIISHLSGSIAGSTGLGPTVLKR